MRAPRKPRALLYAFVVIVQIPVLVMAFTVPMVEPFFKWSFGILASLIIVFGSALVYRLWK